MGKSPGKQIKLAGWMLGDLDSYDKADPPLGREFGYLNDCQEPQSQLLKERIIRSLSKLSQASRIHCTISRRGGARMFPAPWWEREGGGCLFNFEWEWRG